MSGCHVLRLRPECDSKEVAQGSFGGWWEILYPDGGSGYTNLNMW